MAEKIPPLTNVVIEAKALFKQNFGETADVVVFAPGRVNLIGEHTDYNDGFVMPMALPLVTVTVGKKIDGDESTVITTETIANEETKTIIDMRKVEPSPPKWSLYVKGVIASYKGGTVPAFKALIHSTVPIGSGLSSSAAIEVSTYMFLDQLVGPNSVSPVDKALACQKAEHEYAGMPCGIMDQFISVMGQKGCALLIDCRSLESTLIPLSDSSIVVLVINSNVKHELTGSEYPTRKNQCMEASKLLNKPNLRDAQIDDIETLTSSGTDEEIVKRARHVVSEISRTTEAAEALKAGNYEKFGQLMNESHISLRDDYDVSCPEVDSLVEAALEVDGVLGSRMTGAGFGGCTVTLVRADAVDKVIENVKKKYQGNATFYICKPSDGASTVGCECKKGLKK